MPSINSILAVSFFLDAAIQSKQTRFVEGLVYKTFFLSVPTITVDEATEAMAFLLRSGQLEKSGLTYTLTSEAISNLNMDSEKN